jgi:cation transport ATPase
LWQRLVSEVPSELDKDCKTDALPDVASQKGIVLTKGFATIQKLRDTQTVVFDKTGTLTKATLDVSSFQTSKAWTHHTTDFWTYICAVEEHTMSTHPLGRAIFSAGVTHLDNPWVEAKMDLCTEGVTVEPGMGISGDVSIASQPWQHVTIGSLRYLQSCGILDLPEMSQESDRGVIAVHIGIDYTYAGTLLITVCFAFLLGYWLTKNRTP